MLYFSDGGKRFADRRERGWSKVATTLNGLGVLYYKTNKFDEVNMFILR